MTNFEILPSPAAYILLALFSLAIGSLLNVIIYRLPKMLFQDLEKDCCEHFNLQPMEEAAINLFLPRSFCVHCKNKISAWHNIPLLSFIVLRGRCKQCGERIAWRYPLVEGLSSALALFAAWHFGFNLTLLFVLSFIFLNICLFFIDLEHGLLPDGLTLSLLWLGLIANSFSLFTSLPDAVLSSAAAFLALWIFIQLFYLITGKIGMGNGDFKLFAAFGAWFGWSQLPLILLLASFSGAIIGFSYLKFQRKSMETTIPFGPYLCFAGLISIFWGKEIMQWYLQLFLNN
ncbi:prepilin peptidase [Legionella jordanis]|uniref:Prepilin leader peptidase/N-methyltransferase n=1 Tax=Legionella jordanis TaxID=456 RepID=A0A0W0VBF6_9GAMM|nr:A24 family peptidase [Legionella jordanis]KTD17206.1 type 4 (IV) prepilin-like protein leader peptide processing enzyme PilD [Legionella jordanis]RMX03326.1 prepilin peptidase [Legionella jordanis]RMX15805.1 prepilin peptidase [Legionella jordanis]VEH12596.1 type 4 (IV) prepilin-like protein leader peptide processing enzyme PilD [Legionella jordanis]HAT8713330.1 prepilin peptidase [Legionella jordanis]